MARLAEPPAPAAKEAISPRPILVLEGVRKEFGGLVALQGVDLDVRGGEILAIVGDNGAGKSTLLKIVAGVHQPTAGAVRLDGREVRLSNPAAARRHGIEVVYQDLALAPEQPVYMNLFLGRELRKPPLGFLDRRRMARETQELLQELDINLPSPRAPVSRLSGGQRQGIAIARATHWGDRLILMDEPTAALGVQETARVEDLITRLRERDKAIVIVSHDLSQVMRIADRVCVLRRGVHVGTRNVAEVDGEQVVAMITGVAK
jgi:simple sugar transport system ATP-binding protein